MSGFSSHAGLERLSIPRGGQCIHNPFFAERRVGSSDALSLSNANRDETVACHAGN